MPTGIYERPKRFCTVEGCKEIHYGKGYCYKHYQQFWRCGKILEYTFYMPNKFIIEGDICKIECYNNKDNVAGYGIIDTKNYNKCKNIKWYIDNNGYIRNNALKMRLHNFIMGKKGVDHINGNSLDCRENNLRKCTQQQNTYNKRVPSNNTSGYKGVSWDKNRKKWKCGIRFNNKQIHLGRFTDKIKAALAYNKKAIELFGEFACLNEVN